MKISTAVLVFFLMVIGAVVWLFWPPPEPHYRLTVDKETSGADQAVIADAFKVLVHTCTGIRQYWPSFEKREARLLHEAAGYRFERYGWKEQVWFDFKVSEQPQFGLSGASGDTLTLVVGAGSRPGVTAAESWSKDLCHMPIVAVDDQWMSLPDMAAAFTSPGAR